MLIDLVADALLLGGTLCACLYCFVLSRRLKKLSGFESGLGGAIAVLSTQVDDMQRVLKETEATAGEASSQLRDLVQEAEDAAGNLEVLLASLTDMPEAPSTPATLKLTNPVPDPAPAPEPAPVAAPVAPPVAAPEPSDTGVFSFATARARNT